MLLYSLLYPPAVADGGQRQELARKMAKHMRASSMLACAPDTHQQECTQVCVCPTSLIMVTQAQRTIVPSIPTCTSRLVGIARNLRAGPVTCPNACMSMACAYTPVALLHSCKMAWRMNASSMLACAPDTHQQECTQVCVCPTSLIMVTQAQRTIIPSVKTTNCSCSYLVYS